MYFLARGAGVWSRCPTWQYQRVCQHLQDFLWELHHHPQTCLLGWSEFRDTDWYQQYGGYTQTADCTVSLHWWYSSSQIKTRVLLRQWWSLRHSLVLSLQCVWPPSAVCSTIRCPDVTTRGRHSCFTKLCHRFDFGTMSSSPVVVSLIYIRMLYKDDFVKHCSTEEIRLQLPTHVTQKAQFSDKTWLVQWHLK